MLLYSDSRLSGADTVNGGLPKILDGLVYIPLLEQLGVRKKWKQWWVLQLDIEVLLLVIKVVMVWHFVNDVCKVLWLHTLSGCLQTIVIIVLKISFSAIWKMMNVKLLLLFWKYLYLQSCKWWMSALLPICLSEVFLIWLRSFSKLITSKVPSSIAFRFFWVDLLH
jgi:hypothetical protein